MSFFSALFYQIISFTAELMHLRFTMVEQLQLPLARTGSKWFLFIWSKKNHKKNHGYLPDSQQILQMVAE